MVRKREKCGRVVTGVTLTQLIDELPEAHANDAPQIAAGLSSAATVRVKIDVAERIRKPEMAAVRVNNVDKGRVGPRQVTLVPGVHVQRISRIQSGDSAYLKARLSMYGDPVVSANASLSRLKLPPLMRFR